MQWALNSASQAEVSVVGAPAGPQRRLAKWGRLRLQRFGSEASADASHARLSRLARRRKALASGRDGAARARLSRARTAVGTLRESALLAASVS
eukprot:3164270-Lingulodinium_polyedra.AAC.2